MGKIRIIEKVKGMEKEGAIELLKYHRSLRETKIRRLGRQIEQTVDECEAIEKEIKKREKEGKEDA